MISVMSSELESSLDTKDAEVDQGHGTSSNLDAEARLGLHSVFFSEKAIRVSYADSNKSIETGLSNARNEDKVSDLKNEETSVDVGCFGAIQNHPSSSILGMETNSKITYLEDVKSQRRGVVEDYNSMLSDFEEFAAKDNGGTVGYGYEVGDMVWGKVKSHPWWPGHIYNENYASVSVRKTKREGHVLVAFFGDSSYGWFLPADLISFEQNFAEKSRQTNLRSFLISVEEAMDELSRRRSLGLACRCRNEFNFWPSAFDGDYLVDIGIGNEPGIYSSIQISKARDSFQPRKMLSFIQQLALKPRNQHFSIEFVKNKATVLACRKSLFEEFDETYAQAFGTTLEHPQRPTSPMILDPSKDPLSGRLVFAEGHSNQTNSVRSLKLKNQMEKDKYQVKCRDEYPAKKPKKLIVCKAGTTSNLLWNDGSVVSERVVYSGVGENLHQNCESSCANGQYQPIRYSMSIGIKPSEGSEKLYNYVAKKVKIRKQPLVNLGSEHADKVEKKKKKTKKEVSAKASVGFVQLPVALSDSGVTVEKVSILPALHVPVVNENCQLHCLKNYVVGSTSYQVEERFDTGNIELLMLLKNLCSLALNPFHGMDRCCPGSVLSVFLKFRSLVYQKSLVLTPTESDEASEVCVSKLLSPDNVFVVPVDRTIEMSMKPVKSSVRPGDSSKTGKKRGLFDSPVGIEKKIKIGDHPQDLKNKRFNENEEVKSVKAHYSKIIKKKMLHDFEDKTKTSDVNRLEDAKKIKKSGDGKLFAIEKKPLLRPAVSQRVVVKEVTRKNVPPKLKAAKLESSKKKEQSGRVLNPTMLVMKFPEGAGLPSSAELRARFARFGPMDLSATRVFWKSYTCRLVYQYKTDAEAALNFFNASGNLFGSSNVRCYLRDMLAELPEAELAKNKRTDPSTASSTLQFQDSSLKLRIDSAQVTPQLDQLKSCLKKPLSAESGNDDDRGSRVKFVLNCDASSRNIQLFSRNKNVINNIAYFPEATSSSSYSMDVNSKNLSKFVVPPFHELPFNTHSTEQATPKLYPPHNRPHLNNDVSQEMLNLLNKCSNLVSNLTLVLGYVPYCAL